MSERDDLKKIIEEEFTARGIKPGDRIDSRSIAQLYEGSYSLSVEQIRDIVREVARARGVMVT